MTRLLRDDIPGLKYGAKILSNEIAGGQFQGDTYYVKPYSGSNDNDGLGAAQAFKTLVAAQAAATANNGDVVYLVQESNTGSLTTDYQSSGLVWAKDGVHLIAIGAGNNVYLGQRSRISNLSTAAMPSILFTLSANNCIISGLEMFHGVGAADLGTAAVCVDITGMRNAVLNCQISGVGDQDLDVVASASLRVSGSENYISRCYIGLDTIIRAECLSEVRIGTEAGLGGTRNVFEDCIINSYTSATTFKGVLFLQGSAHTLTVFKNCILNSETGRTGCVTVTGAIDVGSIAGHVVINGGGVYGYADVATADTSKILVIGATPGTNVDAMVGKAVDVA